MAQASHAVGLSVHSGAGVLFPERRRELFLGRLRSPGKLDYKRYLESPLRYAGGKSLAVGMIVELLPDGIARLVSPFMGGGSVEVACAKELALDVIGYDVFDILCNYWQVQTAHPKALARRLKRFPPPAIPSPKSRRA